MAKTILITGSTDGIGRAAARALAARGHHVVLHGRDASKLAAVASALPGGGNSQGFVANLSILAEVRALAEDVADRCSTLDVLINNAGVYKSSQSRQLAQSLGERGPAIIAVNPGSLLATKLVHEAFGVAGGDVRVGADILERAALSDDFAAASGEYFDNDSRRFASPHADALDARKSQGVVDTIESVLAER